MRLSSDALEMNERQRKQAENQDNKTGGLWEVLGEVLHEVFVFLTP